MGGERHRLENGHDMVKPPIECLRDILEGMGLMRPLDDRVRNGGGQRED